MIKKPVIFLAYANDKTEDGVYLRNLAKEMHGIREALNEAVKNGLCELVERSSASIKDIVDVFQDPTYESRIALFHYAGHAGSTGILLETIDGDHNLAHKEGLVDILVRQKGLKLVFLNGCSSESQTDALLKAGVSSVIGTTQEINDDIATKLSIRFYRGLGLGSGIEKSWKDAISEIKLVTGDDVSRALNWAGKKEKKDKEAGAIPWKIEFRSGSEIVRKWNLPDAAGNPLFGLPAPISIGTPESPFVYINPFDKAHAPVFFGRSAYIRDLYFFISEESAPSIILMSGQSGVGKTSLLHAGLAPRLEQENEVLVLKRNDLLGLTHTLFHALLQKCGFETANQSTALISDKDYSVIQSLEFIAKNSDDEIQSELNDLIHRLRDKRTQEKNEADDIPNSIGELWQIAERIFEKPLIVLFDQVEEAYTRPRSNEPDEIILFLRELKDLFYSNTHQLKGKILLSYRKEYHSEIEVQCTLLEMPRSRVYLDHFTKEDILEMLNGLSERPDLSSRYNLQFDQDLPELIASDYTRTSNESPVGPVLQIMLTKMWKEAQDSNPGNPVFSLDLYTKFREDGAAMSEFLMSQMMLVREETGELFSSGLVLEILKFHCTDRNTAALRTEQEVIDQFPNAKQHIRRIIDSCTKHFLLLEASGEDRASSLTHDLLAISVDHLHHDSVMPVQQADRILHARMQAIELGSKVTFLDVYDLEIIEKARPYFRELTDNEEQLIHKSQKEEERKRIIRKRYKYFRRFGFTVISILAIVIFIFFLIVRSEKKEALLNKMAAESTLAIKSDNTPALFLAVEGMEEAKESKHEHVLKEALVDAFYMGKRMKLPHYKILYKSDTALVDILYKELDSTELLIPIPQGMIANVINDTGKVVFSLDTKELNTNRPPSMKKPRSPRYLLETAMLTTDKKSIVGLDSDSTLRAWNIDNGALIFENNIVEDVTTFTTLNDTIIYATKESIHFISKTGDKLYDENILNINNIERSPDGNKIILTNDRRFILYDLKSNQSKQLTNEENQLQNKSCKFSSSGEYIIAHQKEQFDNGIRNDINIYDKNGEPVYPEALHLPDEFITYFDFHPLDSLFFICAKNDINQNNVLVYHTSSGKCIDTIHVEMGAITKVTFGSNDKLLIAYAGKAKLLEYTLSDARTNNKYFRPYDILFNLVGHELDVTTGFFSGRDSIVYTASLDGTIRSWNITPSRSFSYLGHGFPRGVHYMNIIKNSLLVSVSENLLLIRNRLDTSNRILRKLEINNKYAPDFSLDSSKILLNKSSDTLILWDWEKDSGEKIYLGKNSWFSGKFKLVEQDTNIIVLSKDGYLRKISLEGSIVDSVQISNKAFPVDQDPLNQRLHKYLNDYNAQIEYSRQLKKAAIVSEDTNLVYLVDPTTMDVTTLKGHYPGSKIRDCKFSKDGNQLVSISKNDEAIVWNLKKLNELRQKGELETKIPDKRIYKVLEEKVNTSYFSFELNSVDFSPNGKKVIISYSDRTARIWNTSNGKLEETLMGHSAPVYRAGYTGDGGRIYTISYDNSMRWYDNDGHYISTFRFSGELDPDLNDKLRLIIAQSRFNTLVQVVIDKENKYVYGGMLDGTVNVLMMANEIFERVSKSDDYKFYKRNKERYDDMNISN